MIIDINSYTTKKEKQEIIRETDTILKRGFILVITGDYELNKCVGLLHIEDEVINYVEDIEVNIDSILRIDSGIRNLLLSSHTLCVINYNSEHFSYEANIIKDNGDDTYDYIDKYKTEYGALLFTIRELETKINKVLKGEKKQKLLS